MSVVTFYNNGEVETAQTTSMAGIATYLSLEQNYRILLLNTKYNDSSLQECFWEQQNNVRPGGDLETGVGGLLKAIASNKTSPEIITNYTRTVFKERLEVLTDNNIPKENYEKQKEYMRSIIRMANKFYDLVFIDLEGNLEEEFVQNVLQESNLIVVNTSQRIKEIKKFMQMRKSFDVVKGNNIMYLLGRYDKYSKYNAKNLQRLEKMQGIYGIPYNTLFFEACNDGTLADFIINHRNARPNSIQAPIMEAFAEIGKAIIDKLKELQMQV